MYKSVPFQSYILSQRSYSDTQYLLSGVLQGSARGLVLSVYNCNPLTASVSLQDDLDFIYAWTTLWLLPLNTNKCSVSRMGNKNPRVQYSINNSVQESIDQVTDLGVILDNGLTFGEHVAHIVKRVNTTA